VQTSSLTNQLRLPLQTSASVAGLLLTPVAGLAAVLGVWRLTADPGWTSDFFIREGLFSRYQFWLAAAVGAQTAAFLLKRWAKNQPAATPMAPATS
jgi:hypothetical protein